jgi:hypothetical protein
VEDASKFAVTEGLLCFIKRGIKAWAALLGRLGSPVTALLDPDGWLSMHPLPLDLNSHEGKV